MTCPNILVRHYTATNNDQRGESTVGLGNFSYIGLKEIGGVQAEIYYNFQPWNSNSTKFIVTFQKFFLYYAFGRWIMAVKYLSIWLQRNKVICS